ncbi:MAG: ABC transporter permease [Oscillospiraceae bacterium]|nr:ABC transporter permease [Oscillospiraceae bacterium]
MLKYIGKRLLMMIPVLLAITLVVQILISVTPGDPARMMLGVNATDEKVEELRNEMGLNDPFFVRYGRYLMQLLHGDFGTSYVTQRTVMSEIRTRFPYTLKLVVLSLIMAMIIGLPVGVFAATHQNKWSDNLVMFLSLFCVSMPPFWFSLLLVQEFAVKRQWFPLSGVGSLWHWILPALGIAVGFMANIARQTRSNMLEVIRQDYIVTAKAKGVAEGSIKYKHALKNALTPIIMVAGGMFGAMLGGALISEVIFSIPGLGQYTLQALNNRDYPVIQSSVLIMSFMFSIVMLLVDVLFAFVDPRIRSQYVRSRKKKAKVLETADDE